MRALNWTSTSNPQVPRSRWTDTVSSFRYAGESGLAARSLRDPAAGCADRRPDVVCQRRRGGGRLASLRSPVGQTATYSCLPCWKLGTGRLATGNFKSKLDCTPGLGLRGEKGVGSLNHLGIVGPHPARVRERPKTDSAQIDSTQVGYRQRQIGRGRGGSALGLAKCSKQLKTTLDSRDNRNPLPQQPSCPLPHSFFH